MSENQLSLLNLYVNTYEQAQDLRKETMNRMRNWLRDTIPEDEWENESFKDEEILDCESIPVDLRDFVKESLLQLEKDMKKSMHKEVKKHPMWDWLNNVRGIGPNLAAKLLHQVWGNDYPAVANLWSYAGLDGPGWRERSHNWKLTSICYLIADSFQYQSPESDSKYRKIYDDRKEYERSKPWCGKCRPKSENDKIKKVKKLKNKGEIEEAEKLEKELAKLDKEKVSCTKAHINNKARRYTVKEFLKDFWVKMQEVKYS